MHKQLPLSTLEIIVQWNVWTAVIRELQRWIIEKQHIIRMSVTRKKHKMNLFNAAPGLGGYLLEYFIRWNVDHDWFRQGEMTSASCCYLSGNQTSCNQKLYLRPVLLTKTLRASFRSDKCFECISFLVKHLKPIFLLMNFKSFIKSMFICSHASSSFSLL